MQFGGLLNSEAADHIIEERINSALAGPQGEGGREGERARDREQSFSLLSGLVLLNMGVDVDELRETIRHHIKSLITDLSPEVSTW